MIWDLDKQSLTTTSMKMINQSDKRKNEKRNKQNKRIRPILQIDQRNDPCDGVVATYDIQFTRPFQELITTFVNSYSIIVFVDTNLV